jgi:type II secretory pathway component PulJ
MVIVRKNCHRPLRATAGFGLVDALVALTLLAVTLLGACGSLHFALRATRAAAWQARAVDLIADLDEDLQQADPALPMAAQLESWRARVQQVLPAAEVSALNPLNLALGEARLNWLDLRLAWNGTPGKPRESLGLPLAHAGPP